MKMPIKTWVGALNFFVLQWFGVRLARRMVTELTHLRADHVSIMMTTGGISVGMQTSTRTVQRGWSLLRWVWPLTGWWSPYRWIARRPKPSGMGCRQRLSDEDGEL